MTSITSESFVPTEQPTTLMCQEYRPGLKQPCGLECFPLLSPKHFRMVDLAFTRYVLHRENNSDLLEVLSLYENSILQN